MKSKQTACALALLALFGCRGNAIVPATGSPGASAAHAIASASLLDRPVLTPGDFTFIGAFTVPQEALGYSTAYASGGFAHTP